MKKGIVTLMGILSFFILAERLEAEMKITPNNFTCPISGQIKIDGNEFSHSFVREAAVISAVNQYSNQYHSFGGYFEAIGSGSTGVYGAAPAHGGYFEASDMFGYGVYGYATGYFGDGVYGKTDGEEGKGVRGYASNTGIVQNYGGYFVAEGLWGCGVYGYASNTGDAGAISGSGGYFEAEGASASGVTGIANGASGRGVYGYASNTGSVQNYGGYFETKGLYGMGVYGYASNTGDGTSFGGYFVADSDSGVGVYAAGKQWDFYAGGGGGSYGPFTGAHEVKFAGTLPGEIVPGMIVSVTGKTEARKDKNGNISLSSTLPTVTLSTKARDKAVFGVIVSDGPLPEDHWYEAQEGEQFGVVNALGEGRVWVTDINGQVQAGDYITTSFVQGYGQLQDDDLLHSYTLGKAIETIDWGQVTETVQHDGKTYKRYLIAVVYTSG